MGRPKNPLDSDPHETLAVRFLRAAKVRRARDLQQLSVLSVLVKGVSELVHALQKERGAASIFLGSAGARFAEKLVARAAESHGLEQQTRDDLEQVDRKLDAISCSARFYARVAFALDALDSLPGIRQQISALAMAPQAAVNAFTDLIALLLAVGFEAADVAADQDTSRALIALVHFAQGKEYAGQERANAGAALSRGQIADADLRRLKHLEAAQERAFKIFAEFAEPAHIAMFMQLRSGVDDAEFQQMRAVVVGPDSGTVQQAVSPDAWYDVTTRRIDAMRGIENSLAADLGTLCTAKLTEAKAGARRIDAADRDVLKLAAPFAMLVTDTHAPADAAGTNAEAKFLGWDDGLPQPMHSILDVVEAQSRRIEDISSQLESARVALTERKTIERAKGILMRSRKLSETDAYGLLRQTAMGQNKRMIEIAESIIGMADIFKSK